jgi:outer membrane receptor protein involved in Fe transport
VTSVSSQYIDQANTCTVPGYSTADARYSYQRGNLEWSLAVNNLANAKYYTLAYGCPSSTVYPEAGRSVAATLKISL